jgi:dolichol-phosphate mannosyltransferase
MTNSKPTLVCVATYNEMGNLPRLVDEIEQALPNSDLLVVDDNSPDGTGAWCDERAKSDPRLLCLHRAGKLGLGTATIAAMQYAIEHGYQYLANLDADFSHPPKLLPELVAGMEGSAASPGADVMIGSRYCRGGRIEGWPLKRHLMSRAINLYSRWGLWLQPHDCSGAYRCYRVSKLAQIDFDGIVSKGYSFQEEILWRLKRVGCRFGELPITFADREAGSSKINAGESLNAARILLRLGVTNWLGF